MHSPKSQVGNLNAINGVRLPMRHGAAGKINERDRTGQRVIQKEMECDR
jgi:hypothetical protein